MRGCLTSLLIFPAILLVAAWFLLPRVAGPIVSAGVGLAGFSGNGEEVTVTADPPIELFTLHADRIHIVASDAAFQGVTMDSVDVTLGDVALLDRTASTVAGTVTGLTVQPRDGSQPLHVTSVALSGSSSAITATLILSASDVKTLAANAVKASLGATPSKITFAAPDAVTITVSGLNIAGRLIVQSDGGIAFKPNKLPLGLDGPIDLITPGPEMPFRATSLNMTAAGGLRIVGLVDASLFGG